MADKAKKQMANVVLEGVRIGFRNFSGKEGQYNVKGNRNFVVFLPDDIAEQMMKDGWNIKHLKPRDEEEEPQAYIQVAVGYNNRPPRVVMVTSKNKTSLSEHEVDILDWAEIKSTDLIMRPYQWQVRENSGIKAYLQSAFITIEEDALEMKYIDVPDSAANSTGQRYEEDVEDTPF